MKNTGQVNNTLGPDIGIEAAWSVTQGDSDIVVAVLDSGVELTHPDLMQNIIPGYDALRNTEGGQPITQYDNHGTAVAGIISAVKDNNIGISGVAPNCKIMPIRIFEGSSYTTTTAIASGFEWAWRNGADVINCSFHAVPDALIISAINNATTQGRNGKGCVIICSAGNKPYGDNEPVLFPGSLYNVMAVGAISYNGKRKNLTTPDGDPWSSNYGSTLDVMAPGIFISTTDRVGNEGYNTNSTSSYDLSDTDYTLLFNGTSAAAPFVSGIAALILSEYPDLPQDLVRRAIELSCLKLAGYTYSTDNRYPEEYKNNEVGYGLVKANIAIAKASSMNFQNTLDNTSGLDFTIMNDSSYSIEDVIIDVTGTINGQSVWLISCDLLNGIESLKQAGYPVYRGQTLDRNQGNAITNITLNLFASCPEAPGNLRVGVAFDTTAVNNYENFTFGVGESYQTTLPNISFPDTRRRIYIRISDN